MDARCVRNRAVPTWLRRAVAVLAGLAAGVALITAVQALNTRLYPPPPGLDWTEPGALAELMARMPVGALLMVELSYAVGSLGAGAAAGMLSRERPYLPAAVVGALLTLAGFANLAAIPHPVWFAVVTTATYVPCALLGARMAASRRRQQPGGTGARRRESSGGVAGVQSRARGAGGGA